MENLLLSNVLFAICVGLQIIVFFVKNPLIKMLLLIGAMTTSLILCFVSPVGFLWIVVSILCAINALNNYFRFKELK